jgi:hypothetical protein
MNTRTYLVRLIVSAAIAATMALTLAALPGAGARPLGGMADDRCAVMLQLADKGSDGQETHG